MDEERKDNLVIAVLIILFLLIAAFETSLEPKRIPLRSPISQTRAVDELHPFNLTLENEGSELRGVINNKTEVEFWIANGTELVYRGTLENYSGAQYSLWINKSIVDTIQVKVVQP